MMGRKPTYEELEQRIRELEGGSDKREQLLAEKTTLLDNILKNAQDIAIATTDLDFRINYYNPMAEKLFGYTAEEVFGKTVQEMHTKENVAPDRFERVIEIVRREGRYSYSLKQETENGLRYLDSQVAGIFNSDGKMVGFSLFCHDVTESKNAEKVLLAEHARFATVMDSLDAGVYATDLQTHEV
ncbi:MAG: PAS domain S-box protein, partial [Deltaproteobacteria bacterium]|nr:PAS domain S-box protein [Deltaproteobacteria bacterium]